jgi:hypothetical protein
VALTVARCGEILSARLGNVLYAAALDGTPASGIWLDPLASAARDMGLALADPTTVTDDDLALLDATAVSQLLDVAELRALEIALDNYTATDTTTGNTKLFQSQVAERLEKLIVRKSDYVKARYGVGLGTVETGQTDLGFASSDVWWTPPPP